jgi:hypothetical protein
MVALAPSAEIHSHLLGHLDGVLRRPGLYGPHETGESHVSVAITLLLAAEQRPGLLDQQRAAWREQGAYWPTGVTGAFSDKLPAAHDQAAMSVYAEFVRGLGRLRTDRLLDDDEYRRVRAAGTADRSAADVEASFGPPSVLIGSTNPRYPRSLCYVPADPDRPVVTLHLWNEWHSELAQPVLLAVDSGGTGPFADRFAFTPEGIRRRPPTAGTAR